MYTVAQIVAKDEIAKIAQKMLSEIKVVPPSVWSKAWNPFVGLLFPQKPHPLSWFACLLDRKLNDRTFFCLQILIREGFRSGIKVFEHTPPVFHRGPLEKPVE